MRQEYEKFDARFFSVEPDVARTAVDLDGLLAEWVTLPSSRSERVILYLHGGSFAFRFPNAHAALAARLCRLLGACALIPDYRLAPEYRFPAAVDDCHHAYRVAARLPACRISSRGQGRDPPHRAFHTDANGMGRCQERLSIGVDRISLSPPAHRH